MPPPFKSIPHIYYLEGKGVGNLAPVEFYIFSGILPPVKKPPCSHPYSSNSPRFLHWRRMQVVNNTREAVCTYCKPTAPSHLEKCIVEMGA
jgi:hypothetical protein